MRRGDGVGGLSTNATTKLIERGFSFRGARDARNRSVLVARAQVELVIAAGVVLRSDRVDRQRGPMTARRRLASRDRSDYGTRCSAVVLADASRQRAVTRTCT